ncbi:putative uncharacterized protein flags: fragment [Bordetella bronchiseptica MO211]|nr:hypothetical protein L530_0380 [Bordetella bronchiseptica MO211]CCN16703.1 putative uncharacterized protein flags: fragment [Bordetella bronchiseptica MO211]
MTRDNMIAKPQFKDKFIAFIDILGFKDMIENAEREEGRSIEEIQDLLTELEHRQNQEFYAAHGPQICPCSNRVEQGLDFEIAQVSDCAIVSAEISPAGVINLIHHCWGAATMLLTKGVMVRGYITRGLIYHQGSTFMGTGYHTAYQKEAGVTAFKKEAGEKGTPFVEVDPSVSSYITEQPDSCVREMFSRFVKRDGDMTVLFPFKNLSHSFAIGGFGMPKFDAAKEKRNNDTVRRNLNELKKRVRQYVDPSNEKAAAKVRHYIFALDEQLAICDQTDEFIDSLGRPTGMTYEELCRSLSQGSS